jgi:hypothetical protein
MWQHRLGTRRETRMRLFRFPASLILAASGLCFLSGGALAEGPCLEGRTAGGKCVNPGLAATNRMDSIIFSQSQLSRTAHPIKPQLDYRYRYPHELTGDAASPQTAVIPTPTVPVLAPPIIPDPPN